VDRGEGATYGPGENIKIYFQASRDCYLVIYNIDTRGYVNLLYPVDEGDDPYVEGGRVYRIPDRFDDYELTVDGPSGVEYVQAVASPAPLDLPNFPGEYSYDGEIYAYQLDGEDPFEFMAAINAEITPNDYASDVCIFSVHYQHPQWYYWPQVVYVDRPVDLYWGGVYFDYPWGVEVWIDGIFYGITPITIPALVVGRHYVSFWYNGCWIWRDWCHVRRGHTIRVWADCYDRYRYVKERYVEKNYRSEKAKRRRGISETGGLIKPVRQVEKGRLAKAEPTRITSDKKLKTELPAKPRELKDRSLPSGISKAESKRVIKQIKAKPVRKISVTNKDISLPERKTEAKQIKPAVKSPRKIKGESKSVRSKTPAQAPKEIRKSESSPPKSTKAKSSSVGKNTAKSTNSGKASVKKTNTGTQGKKRR
jgi:hypothetical protein